jgi:hypothetical protein
MKKYRVKIEYLKEGGSNLVFLKFNNLSFKEVKVKFLEFFGTGLVFFNIIIEEQNAGN